MHRKFLLNLSSFLEMISIGPQEENLDWSLVPRIFIESPWSPTTTIWYSIEHTVAFFHSFLQFLNRGITRFHVNHEATDIDRLIKYIGRRVCIPDQAKRPHGAALFPQR
jgi:hypothetical protein